MWLLKGPSSVWGPNTQLPGSHEHKASFVPATILSPNSQVTKTHNLTALAWQPQVTYSLPLL